MMKVADRGGKNGLALVQMASQQHGSDKGSQLYDESIALT